jgi:heptosyltransferase-2
MRDPAQHRAAQRLLVICPTWVGDAVMATPTLRALRQLYPQAHVTALTRSAVRPILDACPWIDRMVTMRQRRKDPRAHRRRRDGAIALARRLAAGRFDTTIILPNSFRSALLARMSGISRRVGYDRDGRGFLLTDRLLPRSEVGRFVPVPTLEYYLGIARYLGAANLDVTMQLFTRPEDDARGDALLRRAGYDPAGDRPLVLVNPGANYGDAKMWSPDRFAAVADRCVREHHAVAAVTGAPNERKIIDDVLKSAREPMIDLPAHGLDLTLLKSIVKRSRLMVTNDTGPRHVAAAVGTPVVSIFGPTDPAWTQIHFALERQVHVQVDCGPCQRKRCPLRGTPDELVCMKRIDADMVYTQATELLHRPHANLEIAGSHQAGTT